MLDEFFDRLEKSQISSPILDTEKDTLHDHAVALVSYSLKHLVVCEIYLVDAQIFGLDHNCAKTFIKVLK